MRLLLDQNLSPRLVPALADLFPDSTHVREVGLRAADDHAVWQDAAQHGFAIVWELSSRAAAEGDLDSTRELRSREWSPDGFPVRGAIDRARSEVQRASGYETRRRRALLT